MINNTIIKMKIFIKLFWATGAFALAGCGGGDGHSHHGHAHGPVEPPQEEVQLSAEAMKQFGIRVEPVGRRTLQPTFTVPARVAVNEETTAHVGTLVNGRVSEMRVHLGDRVQKGDVLFVIESPELGAAQNDLLKAQAAVVTASGAIELAGIRSASAEALAEHKSAEALIALAQNPATLNAAKAELAAAEAAAVLADNNATIAKAQGDLAAEQPAVTAAAQLVESGRKLAADGALAQSELRRRETALQTAQATVQAATAALAQAKAKRNRDVKSAEAAIAAAQAALAQAEAQQTRDLAAAQAKQAAAKVKVQTATAQEARALTEARNAFATAEAAVKQSRNQLQLLGMSVEEIEAFIAEPKIAPRYTVRAPRDGTVVEREVTLGENTNPNQPHLLILADLSTVWVLMDVPISLADGLQAGTAVALVNDTTGRRIHAQLDFINRVVDTETRTVQARVVLDNPDGQWRPGQFLTVRLPGREPAMESLAVPTGAVQYVDGKPTVYVATGQHRTFKARHLVLGAEVDGWLPVQRGLASTNRVVIHGSFLLKAEFGKAGAGHDHSH